MAPARPLRDVFTELTSAEAGSAAGADPDSVLAGAGHPDLPAGLVAEAIVSYADTAPAEVAEHLAPFVVAHGPVPADPAGAVAADPGSWLDVLASAPDVLDRDPAAGGDLDIDAGALPMARGDVGPGRDPFALDFGGGAGDLDHDVTEPHHDAIDLDHGAAGFGGGASGTDLAAAPGGTAGPDVVGHPYLDDLVALDDLDGADNSGRPDPGADHHGVDTHTVDGDPAGGE